jgi:hypothetical protein
MIFNAPKSLLEGSKKIATHLYNKSNHPRIKGGELYIVYFEDCIIHGELVPAIGIFKSELKDTYLKVHAKAGIFELEHEKGTNIKKLDKGCIVFETEREEGYFVAIVDSGNGENKAQFWRDEFLSAIPLQNDTFQSSQIIQVVNGFIRQNEKVMNQDQTVAIKAKSLEFFQEHDIFEESEFERSVFEDTQFANQFRGFKSEYESANMIDKIDGFEISVSAKRRTKRILRSVIKLDKNFHIYVHGNPENIEKGYDQKKERHFYKLYYQEET